jgi:phospholipid/cholesterol/gamma-HCH transport system substrate-binding protein
MSQAVKVGIFMTVCLVILAYLIMKVEDWQWFGAKGQRLEAEFDSVIGLDDRSAVRIAGVRVGKVDGVRLVGRKARVAVQLDQPMHLTRGTVASIANLGLLGDKFLELIPGPDDAPPLGPDEILPGRTPVSFDQAMAKIDAIGEQVSNLVGSFSGGGAGKGGLGDLVASIQATADELRAVIAENREKFGGTMKNFERFSADLAEQLPKLTERLDKVLAQVDSVLSENRGDLKDSMANIKELTSKVQRSVDNLNQITDKIASGEGTLGKLVNSSEAHDQLMGALDSVEKGVSKLGETLGRADKVRLDLGLESAYLPDQDDGRSAFRLDFLPRGDESPQKYRVELVSNPRGRVFHKIDTVTTTLPDGTSEVTTTDRLVQDKSRNAVSALVGFPFAERRGQIWAGLIESTGGVAVDYSLLRRRLMFSLEAFDFSRELDLDPHLRFTARWGLTKSLFLEGGYDDPLVSKYKSAFVGAGVRWTDDDLKYFLGSLPSF